MITIESLCKWYNNKEILKDIDLEIKRGEILAVVGPNGCGKTTLLRLVNLLERPTSGTIYFDGLDTNTSERMRMNIRRRMAMVFQKTSLFNASVYENVAYGLKIRGEGKGNLRTKITKSMESVGIHALRSSNARTLSGGEAQRAALARALVIEPEVLLLDEPTANLDPYNVALIEGLITTTNNERGSTVVMVTHNVFQARRLAHRVLFLLDGRVVEVGHTEEVFSKPRDTRTAAFIKGDMIY